MSKFKIFILIGAVLSSACSFSQVKNRQGKQGRILNFDYRINYSVITPLMLAYSGESVFEEPVGFFDTKKTTETRELRSISLFGLGTCFRYHLMRARFSSVSL